MKSQFSSIVLGKVILLFVLLGASATSFKRFSNNLNLVDLVVFFSFLLLDGYLIRSIFKNLKEKS